MNFLQMKSNLSQGVKEWGIEIDLSRGREETILELVQEGVITLQIAAAKLSLTVDEVIKQMTEGGYQIPGSC